VGVTGTNGKTTVSHLVERLLNDAGRKAGLIGTLGTRLAHGSATAATYDATNNTTPMADVLTQRLATMRDAGADAVVMEVSSHALDQHRSAGCRFSVAIVTNLTQDHLDYHGTMDRYFAAKARLFAGLQPGAWAILNADDAYADRFRAAIPEGVHRLEFSLTSTKPNVLRASAIHYTMHSTECLLHVPAIGPHPACELPLTLQLAGQFGLYNALAAFAAGLALGLSPQQVAASLAATPSVRGRFEVVSQQPAVIVDYAHTPDGLDNVLRAARAILPPGGRLWAVFGCGGDRDATKRPKMGALAEQLADALVVTSDNPRTEDPQQILADILAGISSLDAKPVKVEADRRQAIRYAVAQATPADVVVVAGKGHEDYQILADRTIHFDDRDEVLAALALRPQSASSEVAPLA
jgi:UDP-N-acetylmuramoyl-L-alanyl-D-glutamate--2,6-diaminopimelate ligase